MTTFMATLKMFVSSFHYEAMLEGVRVVEFVRSLNNTYRLNLRRGGAEGRAMYGFVSLTLERVMKKN
jgi:hypothetical protein